MRFWDASAVLPLLVQEATTAALEQEHSRDPVIRTWWSTQVECASALARLEREGAVVDVGRDRLDALAAAWQEVQPVEPVRRSAMRLLRVHPLRAADALQLAAAILTSEGRPETLPFVTLDVRLADAASREGFKVIRPA